MPDLHKIPVPWSQRLRSIRFRVLPILIFMCAVGGTAYIWNRQFSVLQAVGEVYARRIDLAVQHDGVLLDAPYRNWRLYDRVEANQVLARLDDGPTLALIDTVRQELAQANAQLKATEEEFKVKEDDRAFERGSEARRLAVDVEHLRLAIAERKALLAADEIELARQQERLDVVNRLVAKDPRLVTELETIEIQRLRDVAKERIAGHKQYLADAQASLEPAKQRLEEQKTQASILKLDFIRVLEPLRAAVNYQEARIRELELAQNSLEIRSPIDGYIVRTTASSNVAANQPISAVPGQHVRAGTVLFTIAANEPEYIVSYVRPNQRLRPEVGMSVAIRPRNSNQVAHASIDRVGPQVEVIPPHQLRDQKLMEWGLPIRIKLPEALNFLRPGEVVDLKFLPTPQPSVSSEDLMATRG